MGVLMRALINKKLYLVSLFILFTTFPLFGSELKFICRSDMYKWFETAHDFSSIEHISIQDGWSSRNSDFKLNESYMDEDLDFITQHFSKLRSLEFNLNTQITDQSMPSLQRLTKLKEVTLRETINISDYGLFLMGTYSPQIESLSLIGPLPQIQGKTLHELFDTLPNLHSFLIGVTTKVPEVPSWITLSKSLENTTISKLEFSGYDVGSNDEALEAWTATFETMLNLKEIDLDRLEVTQGQMLLSALEKGHSLKTLTIRYFGPDEKLFSYYERLGLEEKLANGFSSLDTLCLSPGFEFESPRVFNLAKKIKTLRPDLNLFIGKTRILENN